jgi:DNA-binding transcriptional MerR regulator
LRIGELAHAAGVRTSRIRFYENAGLLPPAARSGNGYRSYGPRDLKIVRFVARTQSIGFSLAEIGAFLGAPPDQRNAQGFLPRLEAKLAELDRHIRDAQERRADIAKLISDLTDQGVAEEAAPPAPSGPRPS